MPQPKYRALPEAGGVLCPMDGMALAVSRAAVDETLRDHERFSADSSTWATCGR